MFGLSLNGNSLSLAKQKPQNYIFIWRDNFLKQLFYRHLLASLVISIVTTAVVHKAFKLSNKLKDTDTDLVPHFLKLAADFISPLLTHIFHLSFASNEIPYLDICFCTTITKSW